MGTPYGAASSTASLGQLNRENSDMAGIPAAVLSKSEKDQRSEVGILLIDGMNSDT